MAYSHHWKGGRSIRFLRLQPGQALLDMPCVFPDRLKGASDVLTCIRMALAFDEQRQLHQRSFQGELVLVYGFQSIGEGGYSGGAMYKTQ